MKNDSELNMNTGTISVSACAIGEKKKGFTYQDAKSHLNWEASTETIKKTHNNNNSNFINTMATQSGDTISSKSSSSWSRPAMDEKKRSIQKTQKVARERNNVYKDTFSFRENKTFVRDTDVVFELKSLFHIRLFFPHVDFVFLFNSVTGLRSCYFVRSFAPHPFLSAIDNFRAHTTDQHFSDTKCDSCLFPLLLYACVTHSHKPLGNVIVFIVHCRNKSQGKKATSEMRGLRILHVPHCQQQLPFRWVRKTETTAQLETFLITGNFYLLVCDNNCS